MTESTTTVRDSSLAQVGQTSDSGAAERTILLAEYTAARSEITTMLSMQGQFLNFSIVFFGFVVTMANRDTGLPDAYLPVLPIPFAVLGLSYADVTIRVMRAARYIQQELRPRLQRLGGDTCLGWEEYIRERHPSRGLMQWMDRLRWSFFLGPAIAFVVLAFPPALPSLPWWSWRWMTWAVGVVLVALNFYAVNRVSHLSKRVTST